MRATAAARRALGAVCAALCVLAIAGFATRHANPAGRTWSPLAPAGVASPFRLGTAARPFAWSTAAGDLNADGRPDYAIADRIGRVSGGFKYAVQVAIGGLETQSVTFDSSEGALTIGLRDVDHDQDLDVVVSTLLSPTPVRVWLNDGRGTFAETARRHFAPEWRADPSAGADPDAAAAIAVVSSRRYEPGTYAGHTRLTGLVALSRLTSRASASPFDSPAAPRRSRAPPSTAPLFL